jgi:hypothetical protein
MVIASLQEENARAVFSQVGEGATTRTSVAAEAWGRYLQLVPDSPERGRIEAATGAGTAEPR